MWVASLQASCGCLQMGGEKRQIVLRETQIVALHEGTLATCFVHKFCCVDARD